MSNIEPEDIAKLEEKKMNNELFQVEEIDTFQFDENGKQSDWKGYGVELKADPANYCWLMRDKMEAESLCEFLNTECSISDKSIDAFVLDNCIEWSNLITELSYKETELLKLKDIIIDKEQWIIENTDFKAIYGRNNVEVRKLHFSKHMKGEYENRRRLELSIDYLKRRITYLKGLVTVKTAIMEAKSHEYF